MEGKLHLNEIGRWEIVDELDIRLELTSGSVIEVKVGGHWIRTHIESEAGEYYATTWGVHLCKGLPARSL